MVDELLANLEKTTAYDLGQPCRPGIPHHPVHPPFVYCMSKMHGHTMLGDASSAAECITLGGHTGTHIDALCHFSKGLKLHGGVDVAQSYTGGVELVALGFGDCCRKINRKTASGASGSPDKACQAQIAAGRGRKPTYGPDDQGRHRGHPAHQAAGDDPVEFHGRRQGMSKSRSATFGAATTSSRTGSRRSSCLAQFLEKLSRRSLSQSGSECVDEKSQIRPRSDSLVCP